MQSKSKSKEKSNQNNLSKVYSQFSRQQFNKYKLKFPKLKESEITKKVWKQWQDMDDQARGGLLENYKKKGLIIEDQKLTSKKLDTKGGKQPVNVKSKSVKKNAEPQPIDKATLSKVITPTLKQGQSINSLSVQAPTSVQKMPVSMIEESSDATPDILKQKKPASDSGRQGSIGSSDKGAVNKRVARKNYGQYIQFFRFYYERLTKEHPKWTPNQKTVIIRLLWRKRQLQKKKESAKVRKGGRIGARSRVARQIEYTQYTYFVKKRIESHSDVNPLIIRRNSWSVWKRFNRAGKQYYRKLAAQYNQQNPVVKKEKKIKKEVSPVSFLNNVI